MRLNLSTSWIFQGWITYLVFVLFVQKAICKSLSCGKNQYAKGTKCCNKCGPGYHVSADCSDSKETKCRKCFNGEYQPGWTKEEHCLQQRFCDSGKGFMPRPENHVAEEPCRCFPNFQCSPINCEFCERIPKCKAGNGLEPDPASTNGQRICVPCKKGFYSQDNTVEPCTPWTNCKALGRTVRQPGGPHSDAECGPPISGPPTSWLIVSVLSVITVLSLLILLLFCYKDKLKLLSVNLRSCVQNLKRTRVQQETLPPLCHCGGGGGSTGGPGDPNCTLCEATKLICPDPHTALFQTPVPEVKVWLPLTEGTRGEEGAPAGSGREKAGTEEGSEGSGEPEEVLENEGEQEEDEDEDGDEVGGVPPLRAGSCVCIVPVREPLEVGENEDCSQAVCSGTPGACLCGGLDGERDGDRRRKEEGKGEGERTEKTGAGSFFSLSPSPLPHPSVVVTPSGPPRELCLPLSQGQTRPELRPHPSEGSRVKGREFHRLTSMDSGTAPTVTSTSTLTSFDPSASSVSVEDLYLEKAPEASSAECWGQGLSWRSNGGNKLPSGDLELECPPESLQSQLVEAAPTSGQVTGNHNTTFISSGQVMNFSGDVIVVYVSQTSLGNEEGPEDDFGSPVQEQAHDAAQPPFPSGPAAPGGSAGPSPSSPDASTLPVQEAMDHQRPRAK